MASFKEVREFIVRCYAKDLFDERRKQAMEKKTSLSCGDKHLNEKKSKSTCRGNVVVWQGCFSPVSAQIYPKRTEE